MRRLFGRKPVVAEENQPEIPANPQSAQEFFNRGMAFYGRGEYEAALVDFQQALQLESDSYDVHYGLGLVYKALGRGAEARKAFEEVLRLVDRLPADVDPNRVQMLKRISQAQLDNLKKFLQ